MGLCASAPVEEPNLHSLSAQGLAPESKPHSKPPASHPQSTGGQPQAEAQTPNQQHKQQKQPQPARNASAASSSQAASSAPVDGSAPQTEVVDMTEADMANRLERGMSQRIRKEVEKKREQQRTLTKLQAEFEQELLQEGDADDPSIKKVFKALGIFHVEDPQLRREILENWRVMNAEGKGYLLADEVRLLLEAKDEIMEDDQIAEIIMSGDKDGSGKFYPRQYVSVMAHAHLYAEDRKKELQESFVVMSEGKGFVMRDEVRVLMCELRESLTPELVDRLMDEANIPDDGQVGESDFFNIWAAARRQQLVT